MQDFLIQLHSQIVDPDRIPVILMALVLSVLGGMLVGPVFGNANPFVWQILETLFGRVGERMDRAHRTQADLSLRGFLLAVLVIVLSGLIGEACRLLEHIEPLWGMTRALILAFFITSGSVWFTLLRLYTVMERKLPPEGVYYTVARSTRTNLAAGDDFGIARAALSFSAQSFDKGLVAPSIWYFIGGFPALAVYTGLSFLVWRFGKKGFTKGFAAVPLALERLTGFVPSIVSAVFITLAATFTPTAKLHKGVMAWFGAKDRAPYEQGGFPLSALAWSLHVSLGGAVQELSGSAIKGEWVGPKGATAKVDHGHIRRAIYISIMAHLLYIAALLGAYMWGSLLGLGN